jgi:Sensors of blue-light using FAD
MLYRLIYASLAVADTSSSRKAVQVRGIVDEAQVRNADLGVTGVLCVNDQTFVQVLEGGRDAVNQVYASIVRDERHEGVTLLAYERIDERRFAHWSMVELDLSRVNPAVLLRYLPSTHFDPMAIAPAQLLTLVGELAASVAVVGRDARTAPPTIVQKGR